jgi:hypothetical protein
LVPIFRRSWRNDRNISTVSITYLKEHKQKEKCASTLIFRTNLNDVFHFFLSVLMVRGKVREQIEFHCFEFREG